MAGSIPAHIHLDAHKVAKEVADAVSGDIDDFFHSFARKHRAAVAEEIAQAIENHRFHGRWPIPAGADVESVALSNAARVFAALARSHAAAAGTDTAEGGA